MISENMQIHGSGSHGIWKKKKNNLKILLLLKKKSVNLQEISWPGIRPRLEWYQRIVSEEQKSIGKRKWTEIWKDPGNRIPTDYGRGINSKHYSLILTWENWEPKLTKICI